MRGRTQRLKDEDMHINRETSTEMSDHRERADVVVSNVPSPVHFPPPPLALRPAPSSLPHSPSLPASVSVSIPTYGPRDTTRR